MIYFRVVFSERMATGGCLFWYVTREFGVVVQKYHPRKISFMPSDMLFNDALICVLLQFPRKSIVSTKSEYLICIALQCTICIFNTSARAAQQINIRDCRFSRAQYTRCMLSHWKHKECPHCEQFVGLANVNNVVELLTSCCLSAFFVATESTDT